MKERVQKLMASANIASRRASEQLIIDGRVRINGKVATLGDKADPAVDVITVDGERLKLAVAKRYIAYYKPVNVLSTTKPIWGDNRPIVLDEVPVEGHFFLIGRLDAESEGLIVLTNDGELANKLTHPRYEHTKTYKVTVYGHPTQETLDTWERGIWIDDDFTAPCSIRVQDRDHETTTLRIVMIEGKKRQIRRVAAALGHPVKRLLRTHIGMLNIGTLRRSEWVDLAPEDVEALSTPVSDLSYIRKLRRENREKRRREMMRQHRYFSEDYDPEARPLTPRPSPTASRREGEKRDRDDDRKRPLTPRPSPTASRREGGKRDGDDDRKPARKPSGSGGGRSGGGKPSGSGGRSRKPSGSKRTPRRDDE